MPRTVEHIVATHRLAAERRASGKPVWDETIDVSEVYRDESLTFEERRDRIVAILKRSRWYRNADPHRFDGVHEIIDDHLPYAETYAEFNGWWDELYDHADYDRVWIRTV